ncbi:MAG: carboxylating nicotinate-nucleotide diphosphorylase [Polyangiales bacterium]
MTVPQAVITRLVALALEEDLGRGDVTTLACVDPQAEGRAEMRARQALVVSGMGVAAEVFRQVDPSLDARADVADASPVVAGARLLTVSGRAASILQAERVALNFVQRMSAVATLTSKFVDALPKGSGARITDTRKTTPGLRSLERYAVRCGGGHNHREDLSSAVLIKDNHIAAAGGVTKAIERARARAPHTSKITCEVSNMAELAEALAARAEIIMLDNFADAALPEAVAQVAGRALLEVSGRVSLERVAVIAKAGIDVISVGALTHSAGSVDIGLDWSLPS